jgi:dTDP-4-dehydrorhamnose reductase
LNSEQMKKIIVIGSKGQLGNEFQELEKQYSSFQFFFYDVEEMDIVNKDLVEKGIREVKPDYLINCAAYTAVDKAETDKEIAFAINSDAVRNIAIACSLNAVKFIQFIFQQIMFLMVKLLNLIRKMIL